MSAAKDGSRDLVDQSSSTQPETNPDDGGKSVVSTKNFPEDYKSFTHKFDKTAPSLRDFIAFRRHALPNQPFKNKDGVMRSGFGCRRCHLVHGKVILIYKLVGPQLQLLALFEHDDLEKTWMDRLRFQAAAMGPQDFIEYVQPEIAEAAQDSTIPRRKAVAKRPRQPIFDISAYRRQRDLEERRTPPPQADGADRRNGTPWATDEDMFKVLDTPVGQTATSGETPAETHRRAWAFSVLRMRAADTEWSVIRTVMRSRYLREAEFHDAVVARYRSSSEEERTSLRLRLLGTAARIEEGAAAEESRRRAINEAAAVSAARVQPPIRTQPASGAGGVALRLRCEELEQNVADLNTQCADLTGRLAAARQRIGQLEAEVDEERKGRAAMLAASQAASQPQSQALQVALAEAKLARNLALHAQDQAIEARDAEREATRQALARMRAAEGALVTERAVKSAAQRAAAEAQARVAELEAASPVEASPVIDDYVLLEAEQAERLRVEARLAEALERIAAHEAGRQPVAASGPSAAPQPEEEERITNLGELIFKARRDKGLSVEHVCRLVKVSATVLSLWERNKLGVPRQLAGRLSEVLSVDITATRPPVRIEASRVDAAVAARTPVEDPAANAEPPVLEQVEGESVGERIRLRRTARRLSQTALANLAQVSIPSIGNWESGRMVPSPGKLTKLAEALLLSPDMILTGKGHPVELSPAGHARRIRLQRKHGAHATGGHLAPEAWKSNNASGNAGPALGSGD